MKLGLEFEAGEGPKIARPVRSTADVDALFVPDPAKELRYVVDAVSLIRRELKGRVPLIGFAGSPWTVGTYMVEGGGSKTFAHIKGMMYANPGLLHRMLDVVTRATTVYLNAQIEAGAQAVMVFDTWGGALAPAQYREFSLEYMARIVAGLTREHEGRRVPVVLFTKGGGRWLDQMAATGADALGVDWTTDLADARALTDGKVGAAGESRPLRALCVARDHPRGSRARAGQLRDRARSRVQPWPRHPPGREPGARRRDGGGGARVEPGVSFGRIADSG